MFNQYLYQQRDMFYGNNCPPTREAYIRAHEDNRKHSLTAFSGSAGWIETNQYRSADNLYMILRFLPPGYFENCLLKV